MLLYLSLAWALSTVAAGAVFHPGVRTIQSEASCSSNYTWAENANSLSPCLVYAYVNGACNSNNFDTHPLLPGFAYNPPNDTTADICSCSWAAYNLISACTACQGEESEIPNWSFWSLHCSSFLSASTYFPSNLTLAGKTTIPFWAGTNPTTWPNGQFSVAQANSIQLQNHPDLSPSGNPIAPTKKKSSVGPIVGGVVGGIAALAIVAALVWFFLRRRNRRAPTEVWSGTIAGSPTMTHGRHLSDMSQRTNGPFSYGTGTNTYTGTSDQLLSEFGTPVRPFSTIPPGASGSGNSLPYSAVAVNGHGFVTPAPSAAGLASPLDGRASPYPGTWSTPSESVAGRAMSPQGALSFTTGGDVGHGSVIDDSPARPRRNPPAYSPGPDPDSPTPARAAPAAGTGKAALQALVPPGETAAPVYDHVVAPNARPRREKASYDANDSTRTRNLPQRPGGPEALQLVGEPSLDGSSRAHSGERVPQVQSEDAEGRAI